MLTLIIYLFWRIDIAKDYKIFSYTALIKTRQKGFVDNRSSTLCHTDSFIGLAVPHLRLFLISTMMPLDRCVATGNDLTVVLGKWDLKYTFYVDITRALREGFKNKIEIRPIDALLEVLGFTIFSIYLVCQFEWPSYLRDIPN